jgi:hypothetical protein
MPEPDGTHVVGTNDDGRGGRLALILSNSVYTGSIS